MFFCRWHVTGPLEKEHYRLWDCICDCQMNKPENEREHHTVSAHDLKSKTSQSCGCLKTELSKQPRPSNKKYNRYEERDGYMIGYTSAGDKFYFDKSDLNLIKLFCWSKTHNGYLKAYDARKQDGNNLVLMHRLIMNPNNWDHNNNEVDHINGVRWDNRRSNLRIVTHSENMRNVGRRSDNSSGYKGVSYNKRDNLWSVNIRVDGKQHSECYHTKEEAIAARKQLEKEHYGDFVRASENLLNTNGKVANLIDE